MMPQLAVSCFPLDNSGSENLDTNSFDFYVVIFTSQILCLKAYLYLLLIAVVIVENAEEHQATAG